MSTRQFDIDDLAGRVAGEVIYPNGPSYEHARGVFYGGFDRYPEAIVRVANAADVAATLAYLLDTGLDFVVRSGGHSVAGHSTIDGGVVIDLKDIDDIELDPETATVWAGAGLTAGELTTEVGKHGLAIGFGDTGSVGIGGITLGGGVGFLSRKYGLTIDSLLAAEVVTADGDVLLVDANSHPDLFWALRGGGGNFGVVTRFKYQLSRVDLVVGGLVIIPATPENVAAFIALSADAPRELTTMANVMSCPPMPGVPDELIGTPVIMGLVMWCGDLDEGHRVMDRIRALGEPLVDMLQEMSYPDIYQPEEEEYHPLATALTGFTEEINEAKIRTILDQIEASDAPLRVVQIRVLGGAISDVPNDATAYAHRDRPIMVNVASFYESDEDRPRRESWVRDLWKVLTDGDDAGYVGFVANEGPARTRATYPGDTWDRLRLIKKKYDRKNRFINNQNIPPA